jgi:hypothetical protein
VAWEDGRRGLPTLYGTRIASDGTVLDPAGMTLSIDPRINLGPMLASVGGGQALLAYQRSAPDSTVRVHVRLIDDIDLALGIGAPCHTNRDCTSGFCVDDVCCGTACDQSCVACNVSGQEGTCLTVANPPRGNRPPCVSDGSLCGGSCDGQGTACVYPPSGIACRNASCSGAYPSAVAAAACDGKGICPLVRTFCAPFVCGGTACATNCTDDAGCLSSGSYCDATGACATKKTSGTCTRAGECASGFCADGHCCNSACTGSCSACNVPGQEGSCQVLNGATGPGRTPCASDGSMCAGTCTGASFDCTYPSGGTCRAASCSGGMLTMAAVCDGKGACPQTTVACEPFACSGTACATRCSSDSDCASDAWCAAGSCAAKKTRGVACGGPNECTSGFCADGQCCDRACTEACGACNLAGRVGTCSPVAGASAAGHAACVGTGVCAGSCDGTRLACSYPDSATVCAAATCSGGVATASSTCDGQGGCPSGASTLCAAGCAESGCAAPSDAGVDDSGGVAPPDAGPPTTSGRACACQLGGAQSAPPAPLWLIGTLLIARGARRQRARSACNQRFWAKAGQKSSV